MLTMENVARAYVLSREGVKMDELKEMIKEKIKYCVSCISYHSSRREDCYEAEAVEHLSRALSYLHQIKEEG